MDRTFDRGGQKRIRLCLELLRVKILSEKDSIPEAVTSVFLSPAIEADHPVFLEAQRKKIPCLKRSEFLIQRFNESQGIGISGTSGKTTVTGMLSWLFSGMKKKPFVFCGDEILNFASQTRLGNFRAGNLETMILEIDESDGFLPSYQPHLAGITSLQKDHFPLKDLRRMFGSFVEQSKNVVYNLDCPETRKLFKNRHGISVSLQNRKANYFGKLERVEGNRIFYSVSACGFVNAVRGELSIAGSYNVQNAILAVALACEMGQKLTDAVEGLRTFQGIRNRFELKQKNGSYFILDFAHNPEKVTASLLATQNLGYPVVYVFQPHGYGPLKFMLKEFANAFQKTLRKEDTLIVLTVYDAGGTADRSVTAADLVTKINRTMIKPQALVLTMNSREALKSWARKNVVGKKSWVITGARDETLRDLREEIVNIV
jgi:UDP-N-acetylmuramate--alanine ligase